MDTSGMSATLDGHVSDAPEAGSHPGHMMVLSLGIYRRKPGCDLPPASCDLFNNAAVTQFVRRDLTY